MPLAEDVLWTGLPTCSRNCCAKAPMQEFGRPSRACRSLSGEGDQCRHSRCWHAHVGHETEVAFYKGNGTASEWWWWQILRAMCCNTSREILIAGERLERGVMPYKMSHKIKPLYNHSIDSCEFTHVGPKNLNSNARRRRHADSVFRTVGIFDLLIKYEAKITWLLQSLNLLTIQWKRKAKYKVDTPRDKISLVLQASAVEWETCPRYNASGTETYEHIAWPEKKEVWNFFVCIVWSSSSVTVNRETLLLPVLSADYQQNDACSSDDKPFFT